MVGLRGSISETIPLELEVTLKTSMITKLTKC